jgi:hypothetical protein
LAEEAIRFEVNRKPSGICDINLKKGFRLANGLALMIDDKIGERH